MVTRRAPSGDAAGPLSGAHPDATRTLRPATCADVLAAAGAVAGASVGAASPSRFSSASLRCSGVLSVRPCSPQPAVAAATASTAASGRVRLLRLRVLALGRSSAAAPASRRVRRGGARASARPPAPAADRRVDADRSQSNATSGFCASSVAPHVARRTARGRPSRRAACGTSTGRAVRDLPRRSSSGPGRCARSRACRAKT